MTFSKMHKGEIGSRQQGAALTRTGGRTGKSSGLRKNWEAVNKAIYALIEGTPRGWWPA